MHSHFVESEITPVTGPVSTMLTRQILAFLMYGSVVLDELSCGTCPVIAFVATVVEGL